ncbi:unnamed protein product, partial [Closterium sp. NIES-53]
VATQCECRRLSHDTLLWHHRLGNPSLPRLRSMHSRFLVSILPRSLPPLPPSPAPPCIPCVEGRQRAAPHSSWFHPTEAPLQTLHLDVWGSARVREQGHERYFLLVVDDYTRYTTVFPLQSKGDVPNFAAASAFVTELVAFAAHCRLDYAASLVAESAYVCPPSVGGECALGTDVLEDRQEDLECLAAAAPHLVSMLLAPEGDPNAPDIPTPRSYAEAIAGEQSSQWQIAMDAEMASWKSTGTYVDEVPPLGANIVSGMWIFKVKRPPGSPPVFKARYVARGFSQREGVDFFQTFSPTPKMTTLWVLLHVAAQRDYELHSLEFSTAFLQGSLHEEILLRRPPGFTGTTLAALGFAPSTADPSLFLRTDTSLPPFYIFMYVDNLVFATADTEALALVKSELQKRHTCKDLGELRSNLGLQISRDRARRSITLTQSHMVQQVLQRFGFTWSSAQATPLATGHLLSAPPSDESVEPCGPYPELVGCLMYLMTCTRPDLAYPLGLLACYVALGRHRKELRWLTYLLTDLGERPRSPPILYVDNKAAIALCQEHRLEHRTKHIALRYFLARELQQRGQLRLTYVATWANTADIFTKALPPGDHQRFCTLLGLVPTLLLCDAIICIHVCQPPIICSCVACVV